MLFLNKQPENKLQNMLYQLYSLLANVYHHTIVNNFLTRKMEKNVLPISKTLLAVPMFGLLNLVSDGMIGNDDSPSLVFRKDLVI